TEAFKNKYSGAANVEWKDRITSYSAVFEVDGKKQEAFFDDDGEWKYTYIDIEETDIPAAVNEGLQKSKYDEWDIDRVQRIEKNDNNTEYRIIVKKGDIRKKSLLFNSEGKLRKDNYKL
ncbi:MAG TPA: PepSY-like domain-containing protein, partial [Chitinophagaceae bacterium]|nr:PepSY-like domain-containing protein [Chitinophagaceae bacterium]